MKITKGQIQRLVKEAIEDDLQTHPFGGRQLILNNVVDSLSKEWKLSPRSEKELYDLLVKFLWEH